MNLQLMATHGGEAAQALAADAGVAAARLAAQRVAADAALEAMNLRRANAHEQAMRVLAPLEVELQDVAYTNAALVAALAERESGSEMQE